MLYEPAKDTVCLLGWSKNILVIAFRGTASMTNVWADLSVRPNALSKLNLQYEAAPSVCQ